MIEQTALVTKTDQDVAWLKVYRESTCGSCGVQKGCGTSVFSKVLGNKFSEIRAINTIKAEPGDMVKIGLRESVLLKSAFMMYLFPLFMLLLFAAAISVLDSLFSLGLSQAWIIISGIIGLTFAFVLIKKHMANYSNDERFQPVILSKANMVDMYVSQKVEFK